MAGNTPATLPAANLPAEWLTPDVEDFGAGGDVIDDKSKLIKVPFLIGKVTFNDGDYGPFVSLTCVDTANNEFILNDGSSGIYAQVCDKLNLDPDEPVADEKTYEVRWVCKRGLRVSRYEYTDEKTGKTRPAETYYIA